jgi:hypothetical protein
VSRDCDCSKYDGESRQGFIPAVTAIASVKHAVVIASKGLIEITSSLMEDVLPAGRHRGHFRRRGNGIVATASWMFRRLVVTD